MPRLIFSTKDDLTSWVRQNVKSERYMIYLTSNGEVIVYPSVSTRPLAIAYLKLHMKDAEILADELIAITGMKMFKIERVEWDIEKVF